MDKLSTNVNNNINNTTEINSSTRILSTTVDHDVYSKIMNPMAFNDKLNSSNDISNNTNNNSDGSGDNNVNNKSNNSGTIKSEESSTVDNKINLNGNVRIKEKYVELIELDGKRVSKTSKGKKKFHSKSRNGCINCKRKRIKCDETKPTCIKCQNSKLQCSYATIQPANDGGQSGLESRDNANATTNNISNDIKNISNHLLQKDNKKRKTPKRRVKTVIKYITRREDGTVEISDNFEELKRNDKNPSKQLNNEQYQMEQSDLLNDPINYQNIVKTEFENNKNVTKIFNDNMQNNNGNDKNSNSNNNNDNNHTNVNMTLNSDTLIDTTQNSFNQNIPNELNNSNDQNVIMQGLYALQSLMLQNLSNSMRVTDNIQAQSSLNNVSNLLYKNCNNNLAAVMNGLSNLTNQQGSTASLNNININLLLNLLSNTNAIHQLQNEINMNQATNNNNRNSNTTNSNVDRHNSIRQGADVFQDSALTSSLTNNIPTPLSNSSSNVINSIHGIGFVNDSTDISNTSNSNLSSYVSGSNLQNPTNQSSTNPQNIPNNNNIGINPHMINNSTRQQLQYHLNQQLQLQQHQQIQLQQNQQHHIQQQQQLQNQQQQFLQQLLEQDLTQSTLDQSVLLSTQLQQQQSQMQSSMSPLPFNDETFGQLSKFSLQKLNQPLDIGNQNTTSNNNSDATNNDREVTNNSNHIETNKTHFSRNKNGMFQTAGIGGIEYDFQELLGIKLNSHRRASKISNAQEALATMQKETERTSRQENSNANIPNLNDSIKNRYENRNSRNGTTNNILTDSSNDSSNGLEKTDTSPMLQENTTSATSLLSQMTETTFNTALSPASTLLTTSISTIKTKPSNDKDNNVGEKDNDIAKLLSLSTKANLNLVDMKLFYHYCTTVCYTVGSVQDSAIKVWSQHVPELAFQYPYLMHSLLAFSATHLSRTLSGLEQYVSSHRLDALKLLRESVLEISEDNTDALVASALLLIMDSLANATNTGSGLSVQSSSAWIFHVKGASTILTAVWPLKETSIFHDLISVDLTNLGNFINKEDGTVSELVCFDDSISDLYPVDINSPYLITLAYLNKLHNEINDSNLIFRIFTFPALLDKTFLALLMTGDLNAMRIMRAYYKLLTNFTARVREEFWFLEGISQVLPEDVDEYSGGGGMHMMLDFLGGGLPSMTLSNLSDFM